MLNLLLRRRAKPFALSIAGQLSTIKQQARPLESQTYIFYVLVLTVFADKSKTHCCFVKLTKINRGVCLPSYIMPFYRKPKISSNQK